METVTLTEWLKGNHLTGNEIDFLVTLIPTFTFLQHNPEKKAQAFSMLAEQFPDFYVNPEGNYMEYDVINTTIQKNIPGKISTKEVLRRMSEQGLCRS
ncbi:hypothetical protein [Metabacillus malikii]|uniref:Uncharacterized protein n=1 Tax=Metabacillus malikii TaxID=1504265 RepID=A0ABT9ZA46_9BACI|nr:hypothetical protein [Metabacillus malikii]MDQ0229097.1 hypothetical protein [Metabacillus malikii]